MSLADCTMLVQPLQSINTFKLMAGLVERIHCLCVLY